MSSFILHLGPSDMVKTLISATHDTTVLAAHPSFCPRTLVSTGRDLGYGSAMNGSGLVTIVELASLQTRSLLQNPVSKVFQNPGHPYCRFDL